LRATRPARLPGRGAGLGLERAADGSTGRTQEPRSGPGTVAHGGNVWCPRGRDVARTRSAIVQPQVAWFD
jgi:hypothetical protein